MKAYEDYQKRGNPKLTDSLFNKDYRRASWLAVSMAVYGQLSGVYTYCMFTDEIAVQVSS